MDTQVNTTAARKPYITHGTMLSLSNHTHTHTHTPDTLARAHSHTHTHTLLTYTHVHSHRLASYALSGQTRTHVLVRTAARQPPALTQTPNSINVCARAADAAAAAERTDARTRRSHRRRVRGGRPHP